jgi:hypothetical protein
MIDTLFVRKNDQQTLAAIMKNYFPWVGYVKDRSEKFSNTLSISSTIFTRIGS